MFPQARARIAGKTAHDRPSDQIGSTRPCRADHASKPRGRGLLVVVDHEEEFRSREALSSRPERGVDRAAIALVAFDDAEAGQRERGENRIRNLLALEP